MFFLRPPTDERIEEIVAAQRQMQFTYGAIGDSRRSNCPDGFIENRFRGDLGEGYACFERATKMVAELQMLNLGWVEVVCPPNEVVEGSHVATLVNMGGVHWLNVARVVYVGFESPTRFSFVYGTLPAYPIAGEERFTVTHNAETNTVAFDIYSFARPATWFTRLGWPLVRRTQRRFCIDSVKRMKNAVER